MKFTKIYKLGERLFLCRLCALLILFSFTLNLNNISNNDLARNLPLIVSSEDPSSKDFLNTPLFSIQPFQQPNILFLVNDDTSPDVDKDVPFFEFMTTNLSYTVTYHEAIPPYNYEGYDAIVISSSVGEADTVGSLNNASIPVLTMQAGHFDEFQLGSSYSIKDAKEYWITDNDHYVSQGLEISSETGKPFAIYNDFESIGYIEGYFSIPTGVEINLIALFCDKNFWYSDRATWLTLEKGYNDWKQSLSPERRAFWGAGFGSFLTVDGWFRWNRTLSWILYDNVPGNATIQVEVTDLDNKTVSDARVTLTNSSNSSLVWIMNTTDLGYATYTDIPY